MKYTVLRFILFQKHLTTKYKLGVEFKRIGLA